MDVKINPTKFIPFLSISGITLSSLGGLILFKSKTDPTSTPVSPIANPPATNNSDPTSTQGPTPTPFQVPKSIQHYLLASQQIFAQALQTQQQSPTPLASNTETQQQVISLLNQSLSLVDQAISLYPSDFRPYYQKGKIYLSLVDPTLTSLSPVHQQILSQAIQNFSLARQYNSTSSDVTRDLATAFARLGDTANTLQFLTLTLSLEPTNPQNYYDLAKIQQQTGQLDQALHTYSRLLPLLTDPNQKTQVEQEKSALSQLVGQNPSSPASPSPAPSISPPPQTDPQTPILEALLPNSPSLIIAAPPSTSNVTVSGLTESNSLSGEATIASNQTSLTITNSQLKPDSKVYLAPITKTSLPPRLSSKTDTSFTISLDSPAPSDIKLKWWIVN